MVPRLFLFAALALTGCGGGNLLDNPSFERNAQPGQPPESWDPLLSDAWLVLDGRAASGEFAIRGSGNTTTFEDSLTQTVPAGGLTPGARYRLSARYLPEITDTGATNAFHLGVYEAGEAPATEATWIAVETIENPPEAVTWQTVSTTFTLPELERELVVRLHVTQAEGGDNWVIWVDDVELALER